MDYSSDDEPVDAPKSRVLLGFADVPFEDEEEPPTIEDTFIGGEPIWLNGVPPRPEDTQCGCGKQMALLLQAFAPLPHKPYDRVIYVFACRDTASCLKKRDSVRALRGVWRDQERMAAVRAAEEEALLRELDRKLRLENEHKMQFELTQDLFGTLGSASAENPFGAGSPFGGETLLEKAKETLLEKAKETLGEAKDGDKTKRVSSAEPRPGTYADVALRAKPAQRRPSVQTQSAPAKAYPGYFVNVEKEVIRKRADPELAKYKHLIEETDDDGTLDELANPQVSKVSQMLDDKYFEHFSTVVGHNPLQVLRYDLDGEPLLYSGKDDVARSVGNYPRPAYNPLSLRRFELQLMPKAILDLERTALASTQDILNGMAWGTIVVATDAEDYMADTDVGYVAEYCGVQWEE